MTNKDLIFNDIYYKPNENSYIERKDNIYQNKESIMNCTK